MREDYHMGDLTKNFSRHEVACRCGECSGLPTDPVELARFMDALNKLQGVRNVYGGPLVLSSGYRCPAHNAKVSSTGLNGPHTKGAFDVLVSGADAHRFVLVAVSNGVTGLGISQRNRHESRFIHVDWLVDNMRPWIWSY